MTLNITGSLAARYITLILMIFLVLGGELLAQPLSGILPKFDAYVSQPNVSFEWNSMPGAVDYTVVLSSDEAFTQDLVQSPPQTGTSWTSDPLNFGTWYWKVIGNDGVINTEGGTGKVTYYLPSEDPNLVLWLKADQGVTLDASNKVQAWQDQSPNAHIVQQSSGTKRPIVQSNVLNGFPTVRFQGGQSLNGGDILDLRQENRSSFLVGNHLVTSTAYFYAKALQNAANSRYGLTFRNNTDLRSFYVDAIDRSAIGNTSRVSSLYSILSSLVDRSNGTNIICQNNIALTTTSSLPTSHDMNSDFRFLVGAYNDATDIGETAFLNGNIAEIIFIDSVSTGLSKDVNGYLRHKFSPPLNLGKDSLFSSTFCSYSLTATLGYTNVLWSTGQTSSNISIDTSGIYWVQGTDLLGFVWRDTVRMVFPTIPLPVNTVICAGSVNTWNADMGPGFTYLWSTGATTPSIDISTPGTYNVTVYDGFGCSKNSGDFTFTIDNYPITTTLGADSIMCTGNTIALQVGAGETVDYFWNGTSTGAQPPFWVVDTTGNYFLESVNVNGCVARDTIGVTIIGMAPVADFSLANFCHQDAMIATDLSTAAGADPIVSWSWDFGDGNLSSTQNAQNTYLIPGSYSVELYVEAQSGCAEFKTESIDIRALPMASFAYSGSCDNALTQFSDLSVQGDGTINGWFWNFGQPGGTGPNTSVIQDPSKDYGAPGTYNVYLLVTDDYGCQDDTTISITINEAPQTQFTLGAVCENLPITITNTSSIGSPNTIQNYLWDFGDGTFSILPTPSKSFPNFGWQTITLTSTANNGCTDIEQQQVLIHAIPVQNFVHGPACVGSFTELSDQSVVATGSVAQTSWELDLVDNLQGTTAYYSFASEGSHNVEMTTISDFGCTATATYIFNVGPELSADWSSSPTTIVADVPVQFSYEGTGAGYWDWDLGNGEHSFFTNPLYTYTEDWADSTINVSLYVTNADGCEDTVTYTYLIERATYDLAVEQIYLNENNGFMNVGVRLHNLGTSLIDSVDVVLKFKNGFSIMERYMQVLQSGESVIMVFDALSNAFVSVQDNEQDWICAEGTPYTYLTLTEDDLENNLTCLNREGELPLLIGPNPNPAMDYFDFELLITAESTIDLSMIDARGRLVKHFAVDQNYSPGLYSFHVPLETVESGVYFLRLISGETKIIRKLLVTKY